MTTMELKAKIEQMASIEQFISDLEQVTCEEDAQSVLKTYGLDITLEELEQMDLKAEDADELSEDALDAVAGGRCHCKGPLKRLIVTVICWIASKASGQKVTCPECNDEKQDKKKKK